MPTRENDAAGTRAARAEDAAAIARLCGELGYPATAAEVAARLRRILAGSGSDGGAEGAVFVAVSGEAVVGWVHVFRETLLESDGGAEIGGLVVGEAHRGRGHGRELMSRAEGWAKGAGCLVVRVRSNVVREAAHAFYQARGYRRVKSQHVFRRAL